MNTIIEALGLTVLFTLGSVAVVGGLMWGLYLFFNKMPTTDVQTNRQELSDKKSSG